MSAAGDEHLRQAREAFDLNRGQSIGWFRLQVVTAAVVLAIVIGVAALCGFVILNPHRFEGPVMVGAVIGLLVDLVGVATIYVRQVLSPARRPELRPVVPPRKK